MKEISSVFSALSQHYNVLSETTGTRSGRFHAQVKSAPWADCVFVCGRGFLSLVYFFISKNSLWAMAQLHTSITQYFYICPNTPEVMNSSFEICVL